MEYQIPVTARIRSPLEWMVCCFRCSRILFNLQMFSIILRSGDWDGQSRQSTSLLSFHNCVCTDWCTGALLSWKIHWLFSNFTTTGQRLLSVMSMYLAELIFPSTSVIVLTPSLHIPPSPPPPQNITDTRAPPLRLPYNPKHCVFHLCSDFRHTYTRECFPNTTCISTENIIFFYCSCIVQCSLFRHHRTRFFSIFQRNCQCFRNNSSVKAIFSQSSLNWPIANRNWNRLNKFIHQIA